MGGSSTSASQSSKRGTAASVGLSAKSGASQSSKSSSESSRRVPGQSRNLSRVKKTAYAQIKIIDIKKVYSGV